MKLLECVSNLSEGRDERKMQLFADAIRSVKGVGLLHQDSGYAANRTVYTFAGDPESVIEAAYRLYSLAWNEIYMPLHQGTHPRQGAVDVCPLVPLQDMDLSEAKEWASLLAARIEKELGTPGYFYEANATAPERSNLAVLRKGEYEALPDKFHLLPPDFGDPNQWKRNGVTVLGARKLLIAYNVNLDTQDVSTAKAIAARVRESGQLKTGADGKKIREHGALKAVKGIGWYIEDFKKVQVSYNLTDLSVNGMLEVFLRTRQEAEKAGCTVSGSELIGLAPLSEFEKVQHYLQSIHQADSLMDAIQFLGLHELSPFDPEKKIIDLLMQ